MTIIARLVNTKENVFCELIFHKRSTVITDYDDDINNWIPINFVIIVLEESYSIFPEINAKLNLFEIKLMLSKLNTIIHQKLEKNTFEKVGISTYEFYYEMEFYDLEEDNEIECTVWFYEAIRTNGKIHGVDRGFRFNLTLDALINFTRDLEKELEDLLGKL